MASVPRFFWRLSARSARGGFGRALELTLPSDGGSLDIRRLNADEAIIACSVPAWLCGSEASGGRESSLSAAGLVAIFDEISSYGAAALWDPLGRPGVSVSLSAVFANREAPVPPGARLVVVSRPQRLGRTLCFFEVDVSVEEAGGRSELLLRGRHTKFMPGTGLRPEFLMRPAFRPLTLAAGHAYLSTRPLMPPADPPLRALADVFPSPALGEYALSAMHANPLGVLHGGAAVILACSGAEQLERSSRGGRAGDDDDATGLRAPRRVRTLSANLLSGVALPTIGEVRVRVDAARGPSADDSVITTVSKCAPPTRVGVGGVSGSDLQAAPVDGGGAASGRLSKSVLAVECTLTYAPR
jgi:acyl-coenzyme A thioesterase PaaI-like protein